MKQILTISIAILISVAVFGQNFEGKVVYKNSYISKLPNIKDEKFNSLMGNTQEYFIKGGDYKSVTNGTFLQWQLYINKDNRLYNKMSNSETIFWNDGSVNDDSIIEVQLNKETTEILGYKCDELILTCKSGIQKYYFNSKLSVDSKLYTNHKNGNWYEYLKLTNSLPLKVVVDNKQFSMVSIATEVLPLKLNSSTFQLPLNAKTEKSPH